MSCSSGKHKGETRISHRGRKRLRYWLFQAARSAVAHGEEYKWIHAHYTTRAGNPLQKMQSLVVIACKLLRVIYTMLKTGKKYDPEKLLKDIRYRRACRVRQHKQPERESQDPAEFQKHLELCRFWKGTRRRQGENPCQQKTNQGEAQRSVHGIVLCGTSQVSK